MFKRNAVLEIGEEYKLYESKSLTNYNLDALNYRIDKEKLKIDLKKKRLYLLIEGEELFIRMMTIPKVSKDKIYSMIKSELEYYFKSIKEIVFTYTITGINNKNIELLVFCINADKLSLLKNFVAESL